jgi:ATP-dependent HslUV protease subunit HslV
MSVNRFEQFQTIGSGCDYATGALHALYDQKGLDAETLARKAVEAAIRFNIYCGGEIQVVRVAG